jgi:hypothetical protein
MSSILGRSAVRGASDSAATGEMNGRREGKNSGRSEISSNCRSGGGRNSISPRVGFAAALASAAAVTSGASATLPLSSSAITVPSPATASSISAVNQCVGRSPTVASSRFRSPPPTRKLTAGPESLRGRCGFARTPIRDPATRTEPRRVERTIAGTTSGADHPLLSDHEPVDE